MKTSVLSYLLFSCAVAHSQATHAENLGTLNITGADGTKRSVQFNSQPISADKAEKDGRKFKIVGWRADDGAKSAGLSSAVVQVNALEADGKNAAALLVLSTVSEQKNYTSICDLRAKPACDATTNGVQYDTKAKKVIFKDAKLIRSQGGTRDATDTLSITGEMTVK